MNRAQRRAEKFGRKRPTHKTVSLYPVHLINHCRPYEPGETVTDHLLTHDAFVRLSDGTASEDDFLRVGKALNLALARAADIDQRLMKLIEPSHDALNAVRQRYAATQCLALEAAEVEPVAEALRYAQTIMDASSPQQMIDAEKTMNRVLAEQARNKQEQCHAG